jgi:hypothetical protein
VAKKSVKADGPEYFTANGNNVKYRRSGDTLFIKINLAVNNPPISQTGKAKIYASTNRFADISEGCDENFGLTLMLTKRVEAKKKKAKRDDDDD